MIVQKMSPSAWESRRFALLRFVLRHGDRRIDRLSWRRLVTADEDSLRREGTAIAVAYTPGGQPAGIAFAENYGEAACLVAVHPAFRSRGIGRSLLQAIADGREPPACRPASGSAESLPAFPAAILRR
jgi:GNAT superfamily N-acetyltransferase